jgi:hypothetical protein
MTLHAVLSSIFRKLLMSSDATTWFDHAVLSVSSESFWWVAVQQLGLKLFVGMVWKLLLIIEPYSQWKLDKIQTEKPYWNLKVFLVLAAGKHSE